MTTDDIYGQNVDDYETWFMENDLTFRSEVNAVQQLLPDETTNGIELGVGTGLFAEQLGIKFGLEPSLKMAEKAKERGVQVTPAFIENMPFEDNSFPFALMVTVDCCLDDLAVAFREVHRIVENDGFLIIAFIDRDTPLGEIYQENKSKSIFYQDANFNSRDEIRSALKDVGFSIIDEKQTVFSSENMYHEIKAGLGEGLFAVIKAKK
ncbi:MAG: class I SAM-dependent methyltransferase [Alkalibacterium sp.]|uniref:class I SAM-dependent DNA methyltransferase n=1 Tax=Alkalibacterium sp. TaxID=1872447 RepID=UPI003970C2A8